MLRISHALDVSSIFFVLIFHYSGTGDILLDMENQVKANIVRIQLLETQNDGLRNSIRKLESIQHQQPHNYYDEREDDQRWAVNVQVCSRFKDS
jgi:hypothetical protein